MLNQLIAFLNSENEFYIEVEGKLSTIHKRLGAGYVATDDGICVLDPDTNKWGLEYRLYTHNRPSSTALSNMFHRNTTFRHSEYEYRLSDNNLVSGLLGTFNLGHN